MSYIKEMLETHPRKPSQNDSLFVEAITANWSCAESCVACADACLGEENMTHLARCIRLCHDCADVCETTARLITRQTETDPALTRAQLQACVIACQICGAECEKHHFDMEHCKVCAEACHRCERACKELILKF